MRNIPCDTAHFSVFTPPRSMRRSDEETQRGFRVCYRPALVNVSSPNKCKYDAERARGRAQETAGFDTEVNAN
ncbi:hypothetical protein CORC01_00329 [Colletotrichum orchidophilum]|uniref:Uncharacterized protein n=1 Tax=Colletotrichum orchidophilum TaxID=1209926 RepID=A0A1G4BT95_9PEZI|nr:uncharacterized protein CORC01_00329 [Colletotrichum orchidophilum]OHF04477.1 hypothetical protein CORC01_00329 [Colletotrichum orchidophilum]